MMHPQ
jgi:hypothetical protein